MKLRAFTPEETDELLEKFDLISKYAYEVNAKAFDILKGRYNVYKEKFSWSLFKWKPIEFKEFTQNLNYWEKPYFSFYTEKDSYGSNCIFKSTFLKDDAYFFRYNSWSLYSDFMVKKGCYALSDAEIDILESAGYVTYNFVFNYDLREKYKALFKYAHRPFEFDESDIKWLETIDIYFERAKKWYSI